MVALTDVERKAAIIDEVGDPSGTLATKIDTQWTKCARYESVSADLRDLYVKRGIVQIEYARLRRFVDFTDGDNYGQKASQAAAAALKMLDDVKGEIEAFEGTQQGVGGAAIGELTTVSPESPPSAPLYRPYGADALDPPYLGSPYYSGRRRSRW